MTDHETDPVLKAAWVGSSIGALDLGLVVSDVLATAPSEQLLGADAAGFLFAGYAIAGGVSLYTDLMTLDS